MYKIQTNLSGTRTIIVSDEHLRTIKDYALLKDLIDSNGIIDAVSYTHLRAHETGT